MVVKKREKKAEHCARAHRLDNLNDALLITGSNPDTKKMMYDLNAVTELSSMLKAKPRTFELRRRSLKTEHCLQITMNCDLIDISYDSDSEGGAGYGGGLGGGGGGEGGGGVVGLGHSAENGYDNDEAPPSPIALPLNGLDSGDSNDNNGKIERIGCVFYTTPEIEREEKIQDALIWDNAPYKIFMENIAPDVAEHTLTRALRNCGGVNAVKFIRNEVR